MRTIIGNIKQANKAFDLIEDKDYVCVGVSGGKDSMLLLEGVSLYKKNVEEKIGWDIKEVCGHRNQFYIFLG